MTQEARAYLKISMGAKIPSIPGMKQDFEHKDHQIKAIAWMSKKQAPLTIQESLPSRVDRTRQDYSRLEGLVHVLISRAKEVDPEEREMQFGQPGPIAIAVPTGLAQKWLDDAKDALPAWYNVCRYGSSTGPINALKRDDPNRLLGEFHLDHPCVMIASHEVTQVRHSKTAHTATMKNVSGTTICVSWIGEQQVQALFFVMIPEAQRLRQTTAPEARLL
ncbi:hypothetical protein IWZ03DRAFT_418292 [Phyllosticta citriasiana]|uniref:Uncharacterized protein n=1 Tax=Phyllosticta citriasiana TaxID=595635 RepID=A0ABR1KC90_9PEZI